MWHMCSIVDWALMLDPMTKQVENMDSALHPLNVWPINVFSHWKTEYLNHLTVNSSSFIITNPLTQEPMISPWCFLNSAWRRLQNGLYAGQISVARIQLGCDPAQGSKLRFRHSSLENGIYERDANIFCRSRTLSSRLVQHFGVKISHLNRNLQHLGPKIGNSDSVQLSLNLVCRVFAFAAYWS